MTEDMRERFETWALDYFSRNCRVKLIGVQRIGEHYISTEVNRAWTVWQAALSSAGTSGTVDFKALVADLRDHYNTDWDTTVPGKEFDAEIERIVLRHLRGDSLSGKGGATKEEICGGSVRMESGAIADAACIGINGMLELTQPLSGSFVTQSQSRTDVPSIKASAPDRAEELARLTRWKYFDKTDLLPAGFSPRPNGEWVKFTDVASLLREAMAAAPPREGG